MSGPVSASQSTNTFQARCTCRPARKFHDDDVCKYHLCGFCPYEEFDKTRTDYGPCPSVHDDRSKGQWEALSDEERAKYPYERELKKWLDKMVDDLGKKVKRNQDRLDSEANPAFLPDDQVNFWGNSLMALSILPGRDKYVKHFVNICLSLAGYCRQDGCANNRTAFCFSSGWRAGQCGWRTGSCCSSRYCQGDLLALQLWSSCRAKGHSLSAVFLSTTVCNMLEPLQNMQHAFLCLLMATVSHLLLWSRCRCIRHTLSAVFLSLYFACQMQYHIASIEHDECIPIACSWL